MEWLLRRNFWLVKTMGLLLVTALTANATTTLLGLYLISSSRSAASATDTLEDDENHEDDEDDATLASVASTPRPDVRVHRAERTAERILGYSPFCPTCGPTPPPAPEDVAAVPGQDDLAGARRSTLPLVVAATMESDDPALSLATLVHIERGVGGLYGVGDALGSNVEIVHVATGVVHIRNAGQLEYIPFDGLPPPPKTEPSKPTTKEKKEKKDPKPGNSIPGAEDAIQCTDKGDCTVDRAFVEQLIAQPKLLLGQGGAAPTTTTDGAPGFRLRGVRRGTLPDLLGLKNGDVITEVGGTPLTMDVVAGLYGKLRHASNIEVTVDRRGQRVTRQLSIRS